jgi:hypothetical protein
MKAVAINGSPRKGGNNEILLKKPLRRFIHDERAPVTIPGVIQLALFVLKMDKTSITH